MATIVNTTEEEPMLAVVRFTAELAWADAGPEVADPEVTRLCLEAQEHILAGRWLDMASLMLASADLLLTSPSRVPDKGTSLFPFSLPIKMICLLLDGNWAFNSALADLECILSVICSLVTKAESEEGALQITDLICAKLTQQPDDKPALRLKVLFSLYNLLPSPYGKAFVYKKALELATAGKATEFIIPSFKNINSFVSEWGIGNLEQRELYLAIARILKDHKGLTKEYSNFLNKYLATFKGSDDDSATIGDAKEEAVAAIIEFVKSSTLFQCDLLNMPAVAQLEKDEKYQLVYELLKIFLTKRLDSYLEFQTANSALLKDSGLIHEECITKMRLMSLLDLSSCCSSGIPYSAITEALQINDDEVEQWVVKAIAFKILDCKVDQLNQTVIVSRHTERIFGMAQWQGLRTKLGVWRGNIASAINTIQANKVTDEGTQGMQGLMIR
ncbi:Eukaryotic translation initiation factor 3 subunit M [Dichanthelium oligosanthes]|uniref:Eukaryotic translation initiation factor 3 subunit M n=1 Tax=Dichanthelium oligosanthes TaxID=888268 RepID=A0A1E5W9N5_9POAL|nr:Eukaryotic translation initiation factor 3 subunit M [Dichanthelium oligosanthes]